MLGLDVAVAGATGAVASALAGEAVNAGLSAFKRDSTFLSSASYSARRTACSGVGISSSGSITQPSLPGMTSILYSCES